MTADADQSPRHQQAFPVLTAEQMKTATRFASSGPRRFGSGENVSAIGDRDVPAWLIVEGELEVFRHDGLSGDVSIVTHGPGHFSGETTQLSGRPALAGSRAGSNGCVAMAFDATHLKALIIGSAEIGEIIMRAYILRRVALIDGGGAGSVLIGHAGNAALTRLQGFLTRNGFPHVVLDATSDPEAKSLVQRLAIPDDDLPLMVCPNGSVLKQPSDVEAAACVGISPQLDPAKVYDVAIVGAGPSGLAAAVYAASEGLSVIVIDERAVGGQAGASARIENYLGFPTGISGQALAGRAFNQALKFGVEIALPLEVQGLEAQPADGRSPIVIHARNQDVTAKTVVIASGARYRKPDIENIDRFEAAISYWATAIEARLCENAEVALIGGGNSAGQAVAFLAPKVKTLHLVVRRDLKETMSAYLIERIAAIPNVVMHVESEIVSLAAGPETNLKAVLRDLKSGLDSEIDLRRVFLFIGADPNTHWLGTQVRTDNRGFVVTGTAFEPETEIHVGRAALPLETNVPNVFAIGDVRAASTKRVAAAVGDGAAVVSQIHEALKSLP
ncbi:FAD-dependent oxidoreductase [Rhizobium ruizarguesonis]